MVRESYLFCEDVGQGAFSSERILKFRDYYGQEVGGFFDNSNIGEIYSNTPSGVFRRKILRVDVLEKGVASVKVALPQESFNRGTNHVVRIQDIFYDLLEIEGRMH